MLPMPNLWTNMRRELGCTPTLERINTDYDPGSVVSMAQSNQQPTRANNVVRFKVEFRCKSEDTGITTLCQSVQRPLVIRMF